MLEEILEKGIRAGDQRKSGGVITFTEQSTKEMLTENNRTQIPLMEEIEDQIDYKITRNSLCGRRRCRLGHTLPSKYLAASSSRHKLIPKGKPGEYTFWDI